MSITYDISAPTTASKERIWSIWQDVPLWKDWDSQVEWASLNGTFKTGQTGLIKPKGAPKSTFTINRCTPFKQFSDTSPLPFARLTFDHVLEPHENGLMVHHRISISGPLSFLFNIILGKQLKKGLETGLPRLITLAESRDG